MGADMDNETATPNGGSVVGRGVAGGAAGGAVIGGLVLFLGSVWSVGLGPALLATPIGAIVGCPIGLVVGGVSGAFLNGAGHRVVGHDGCARRLAFTTSAAPFLLFIALIPDLVWVWLCTALVSGIAGAVLAPWVVRGRAEGQSAWS
jgi:hypothetical protein